MTAHPESVVAKLRSLMQRADEAGFDPPHYAAQVEYEEAARDTVPTLLTALEAVWDALGPVDYEPHPLDDSRAGDIRIILAPLFESQETPYHD